VLQGSFSADAADAKILGVSEGDRLGYVQGAAAAGDVNGDGIGDLLLGAMFEDTAGEDAGAAYLVLGSVDGVTSASESDAVLRGEAVSDRAGRVASAGDVDGDGFGDFLVGAYYNDTSGEDAGAAYLIRGPVLGEFSLADADAKFLGEAAGDFAGASVASAGDVDADGHDDVAIGANLHGHAEALQAGSGYVIRGPIEGEVPLAQADLILRGEAEYDRAGLHVVGLGDTNDDGRGDVAVSAHFESSEEYRAGAVYVVDGSLEGEYDLSVASAKLLGEAELDYAGYGLARAGDINGDGFADVLVGAAYEDEGGDGAGAVYAVYGPFEGTFRLDAADAKIIGEEAGDYLSVHDGGDVNGDGLADVHVSAIGHYSLAEHTRRGFVFFGPVAGTLAVANADVTFVGEETDDRCCAIRAVGDVNADGVDDILLADDEHDGAGENAGAVYLFWGIGI